jgi:hypothetical protein
MGNRKNIGVEIGSIFIFTLGVFTFFSLVTYHSSDPGLFTQITVAPKNSCGRMGAWLAKYFLECLGLGAFILPALLLSAASAIHNRQGSLRLASTLIGVPAAVVSLTVFLSLHWKELTYGGAKLQTGGALGTWVSEGLLHQLNSLGSSIVALLVFCLALIISTPINITQAGARLLEGFSNLLVNLLLHLAHHLGQMIRLGFLKMIEGVKNLTVRFARSLYREFLGFLKFLGSRPWFERTLAEDPIVETQRVAETPVEDYPELELATGYKEIKNSTAPPSDSSMGSPIESNTGIQILPREAPSLPAPSKATKMSLKPKRGHWRLPTIEFLRKPPLVESAVDRSKLIANSQILKQ